MLINSKYLILIIIGYYMGHKINLFAQSPCINNIGAIYGTSNGNERGTSLAATPDGVGFYVAGIKDDSSLIAKIGFTGEVIWTRTFDIVPNKRDNVVCIIVDSDENIVFSGVAGVIDDGGSVFVVKFNPATDQVLWARQLISSWTRTYHYKILEKDIGGNYLIINNPHNDQNFDNNGEIMELNRNTGYVETSKSKIFSLGSSEHLGDIEIYGDFIFAVGRYTYGSGAAGMRHALMQLTKSNYNSIWTGLGHVSSNNIARLYGMDLIVNNDKVYSSYHGDPAGTNTSASKIFVQKTSLDGELDWVMEFDVPGINDYTYEMVAADDGIIMLSMKRSSAREVFLFKFDFNGKVLWSKQYDFPLLNNIDISQYGQHHLISIGDLLVFTGHGTTLSDGIEMFVVITDENGESMQQCLEVIDVSVISTPVSNPVFNKVSPDSPMIGVSEVVHTPMVKPSSITYNDLCVSTTIILENLTVELCRNQSFEGYSAEGIYIDTFVNASGCDSVRFLTLLHSPPIVSEISVSICMGDTIEGYWQSGMFTDTIVTIDGCDSIRVLMVEVLTPPTSMQEVMLCEGSTWEGYSVSGIYIDTLLSKNGCDSIRIASVSVVDYLFTDVYHAACEGDSYNGHSVSGIYVDTFASYSGCDSIVELNLEIQKESTTFFYGSICNEQYKQFKQPGIFTDTLINRLGCDSIIIYEIKSLDIYSPNVFTPNGDQINDLFFISHNSEPDFELVSFEIFDRMGNQIFLSMEWPFAWDGNSNKGAPMNPGVYAYVLKYECGGSLFQMGGDITLLR